MNNNKSKYSIYIIIGLVLAYVLYSETRDLLLTDWKIYVNIIFNIYARFLLASTAFIIKIFNYPYLINWESNTITTAAGSLVAGTRFFSFTRLALITILLLVTPGNIYKRIKYWIFFISLILAINVLWFCCTSVYQYNTAIYSAMYNAVNSSFLLIRNLAVLLCFYLIWKNNNTIKNYLNIILPINNHTEYKNLFFRIATLLISITIIEFTLFNNFTNYNGLFLTNILLTLSQKFVSMVGYVGIINGRLLECSTTSVYVADPCLGIDLMITFAGFIYILPGKAIHKLWYISLGILLILFINVARISIIFINLQHSSNFVFDAHDLFTYPVYFIVLTMWGVWINIFCLNTNKLEIKQLIGKYFVLKSNNPKLQNF